MMFKILMLIRVSLVVKNKKTPQKVLSAVEKLLNSFYVHVQYQIVCTCVHTEL